MHLHATPDERDDPDRRWSPAAAAASVLLAVAFVVLGVMVVGGGPLPVDTAIREALGVGRPVPAILQVLNDVGGAISWDIGVAIVAAILLLKGRRRESVWLAGCVFLGETLATGAKLIVDRQRPPGIFVEDLVTQASYPSGHVTRTVISAALLVVLLARAPWTRIGGLFAAVIPSVLMGLARIAVGEHWPTDVLGGYLLGGVAVAAVIALPPRLTASRPGRRPPA